MAVPLNTHKSEGEGKSHKSEAVVKDKRHKFDVEVTGRSQRQKTKDRSLMLKSQAEVRGRRQKSEV